VPTATRDDLDVFHEQEGDGDPPLVLVHGWCCDHTFFAPQVEHFRGSHRVVTVGLRPERDVPTLADDLARLCAGLGLARPVVIGHSLGGMIAVELAARHPSVPLAVVGVDPGPLHATPEALRLYAAFADAMEGPEGEAVRRAYVEEAAAGTLDPAERSRIVETMCSVPLPSAVAGIRGVVAWNGVGALAMCRVPTLVLRARTGGSNDPARLLAIKPDLHLGVVVGAGHFMQLDVPEQVNPMLERFLRIVAA
jgi:pimeloyl-ACP methyl ester carboxylesterase